MKYTIKKVDLSNGAKEAYTSFYYKRGLELVYEVTTDGFMCAASVQDKLNIRHYNSARTLPKYIASSYAYLSEEFEVGMEFKDSDCRNCKIEIIKGNDYYYSVEGFMCLYICDIDDLRLQIKLGKENAIFRAAQQKRIEAQEAEERKELERYNDIDGFKSDVSKMQSGKILSTLNKQVRLNGVVYSVKDAVKMLIEKGYEVSTISYWSRTANKRIENKPCFKNPETGSIYDGRWVTKTALEYMTYLKSL